MMAPIPDFLRVMSQGVPGLCVKADNCTAVYGL